LERSKHIRQFHVGNILNSGVVIWRYNPIFRRNDLFKNDHFVRFNFYFFITTARVSNEKTYIMSSFSRRSFISFDVMTACYSFSTSRQSLTMRVRCQLLSCRRFWENDEIPIFDRHQSMVTRSRCHINRYTCIYAYTCVIHKQGL